jgi:hypothetical protein
MPSNKALEQTSTAVISIGAGGSQLNPGVRRTRESREEAGDPVIPNVMRRAWAHVPLYVHLAGYGGALAFLADFGATWVCRDNRQAVIDLMRDLRKEMPRTEVLQV